jgi:hypothetical protein
MWGPDFEAKTVYIPEVIRIFNRLTAYTYSENK